MKKTAVTFVVLILGLGLVLACGEGNPVAPTGTTLTITANPTQISLSGASTLTIIGRRPDGNPLAAGTEIRLTSTIGTVNGIVETDAQGRATTFLRADNRSGTATIEATTADATASTDVVIGETDETRPTITLTASPSEIDLGETSTISAIARNPDGSPVSQFDSQGNERLVRFFTSLGTISESAPLDDGGVARATLGSGDEPGTAEITAFLGASDTATISVSIDRVGAGSIFLQANRGSIDRAVTESIMFTAIVRDDDGDLLGGATVTFEPEYGSFGDGGGNVVTGADGRATATLTVPSNTIPDTDTSLVVRALVSGSTGVLQEDTVSITVTG